jgi:hypothetical protein
MTFQQKIYGIFQTSKVFHHVLNKHFALKNTKASLHGTRETYSCFLAKYKARVCIFSREVTKFVEPFC